MLLFFYLRRRVGEWLALAGVLPVLFMGTAWEVLLWPFEVYFTGSMAAGIGALLALERDDERGDALACALLVVSLAFSELALSFVLGAAVWMIMARRRWSRAYVIVIPLLLYAAWYAGWGHTAQSHVSVHNLVHSPNYMLDGLASSAGSLLGVPNTASIWVGRPLLLLLVVAVVVRIRSAKPLPRSFWSALAVLLSFWFLDASAQCPDARRRRRGTSTSAPSCCSWSSPSSPAESGCGGRSCSPPSESAGLAVITNLVVLRHDYGRMSDWATRARGALAAFEVGGASADPGFTTGPANTDIVSLNSLQVGPYLSAVDAFGSPATARRSSPAPRRRPASRPTSSSPTRRSCGWCRSTAHPRRAVRRRVSPAGPAGPPLRGEAASPSPARRCLPTGRPASPRSDGQRARGSAETVELRRFASSFPVRYQLRGTGVLLIRSDRSPRPWQLRVSGPGPTRICGIGAGQS